MGAFFTSLLILLIAIVTVILLFKFLFFKKGDQEFTEFEQKSMAKAPWLDIFQYTGFFRIAGFAVTVLFSIVLIEYTVGFVLPPDLSAGPIKKQVTKQIEIAKVDPPKPKPKKSNKPRRNEIKKNDELKEDTTTIVKINPDSLFDFGSEPEFVEEIVEEVVADPEPIRNPGTPAQFPGGPGAFRGWVYNNIEVPEADKIAGTKGLIMVGFIVDVDGSVIDVEIKKGLTETLNQAVVSLFSSCPNWTPARHLGQTVPQIWEYPVMVVPR